MLLPKYPPLCPVEIKTDAEEKIFFLFVHTRRIHMNNTQNMSCKITDIII